MVEGKYVVMKVSKTRIQPDLSKYTIKKDRLQMEKMQISFF